MVFIVSTAFRLGLVQASGGHEGHVSGSLFHACRLLSLCSHANPVARLGDSSRQRPGQPESWEHVVVEASQGADLFASESEDEQAGTVSDTAGGGVKVGAKCLLAVGP